MKLFFKNFNRGRTYTSPRGRISLPKFLALSHVCLPKRRPARPLSWPRDPAHSSDPQHCHHDVHLRAYRPLPHTLAQKSGNRKWRWDRKFRDRRYTHVQIVAQPIMALKKATPSDEIQKLKKTVYV